MSGHAPGGDHVLTAERRRRIDGLLGEVLDRPVAERRGRLRELCGEDDELLEELDRLIRADEHGAGILDLPVFTLAAELARDGSTNGGPTTDGTTSGASPAADDAFGPGADSRDRRLGPYRIVREIGRGGMGRVYLAVRDDAQFEQRVAIKVLDQDYSATAIGRFLAERQILASLEHAHIARLLDGGTTTTGRPYFVMEYVLGEPLDRYCDLRALSIDDRLRLVCKVAMAVQHAHRNLVVHRDLKPSNILVTFDGEPKLLDFGIAKLLDPGAAYASPPTHDGERMMTPEYASPEQLSGQPVTTAVDVYALGLILYEVLAGHRPQERGGLRFGELERRILTRDPVPPSEAVLAAVGDVTPDRVARARGSSPWLLQRKLRGDLDRIVLMALRKEPARRYASAEQLAADIGRYLDDEPVIARGDATTYRLKKFVVRHWVSVASFVATLLLVAGYALTVTVQDGKIRAALDQARLEAERAEQVTAFTMELFEPGGTRGGNGSATVESLLARSAERIRRLDGQPAAQAAMHDVVGRVHQRLGDYGAAQASLDRALALRRRTFGDHHAITAESMQHLAALLTARGRYAAADSLYREALTVQTDLLGERHPKVARTLDGLGLLAQNRGDLAGADSLYRAALAMRRRFLGDQHPEVAQSLDQLGALVLERGSHADAERLLLEALAMRRRLLGDEHAHVAETAGRLVTLYESWGYPEYAVRYRALAARR